MNEILKRNLTIYYITRAFCGLRFIIPIWVTFFLRVITFEQMAFAELIASFIGILFEFPSGVLADIIGRKWTVAVGFIISGIGYTLLSSTQNMSDYIIYYAIANIGNAFISGAEDAFIYDSLKEADKLSMFAKVKSTEAVIYRTTLLISTIVGGYIYKIKIFLPYFLTGIAIILTGVVYLFAKEPHIDTEKFNVKTYLRNFFLGFRESFKSSENILVSIYYILIFSVSFLLMGFFEQPYTKWLGFDETAIGWIFGLTLGVKILTMSLAPSIAKRLNYKTINFLLPFLTGIVLFLSFHNKTWGLFVLFVENIILAYRFVFTDRTYNHFIDSKFRASAISTVNMFINIIFALSVFVFSRLIEFKNIGISFNIFGIIFLFASIISLFIKSEKIDS